MIKVVLKQMKSLILYLIRWQLSTPILTICLWLFSNLGALISAVVANLIGGLLFFKIDKYILKEK